MGFGEQFVNSAVNQTGKNTDRIVSNNVFGESHSIKDSNFTYDENAVENRNDVTDENLSREEFIEKLKRQGYRIEHTKTNIKFHEWGWFVGGTILAMIPLFGLISPLLALFFAKTSKDDYIMSYDYGAKLSSRVTYSTDRKQKGGAKITGSESYTDIVIVPPTDDQWNKKFKKSYAWLLTALSWFVFGTLFFWFVARPFLYGPSEEYYDDYEEDYTTVPAK